MKATHYKRARGSYGLSLHDLSTPFTIYTQFAPRSLRRISMEISRVGRKSTLRFVKNKTALVPINRVGMESFTASIDRDRAAVTNFLVRSTISTLAVLKRGSRNGDPVGVLRIHRLFRRGNERALTARPILSFLVNNQLIKLAILRFRAHSMTHLRIRRLILHHRFVARGRQG